MSAIRLNKTSAKKGIDIHVPGSKSESNRALIINALCPAPGKIANLAIARDTDTMQRLLAQSDQTYDVLDAGTTMRFMTAYLSLRKSNVVITGTERMQKRPIKVLVEALKTIGVEIEYRKEDGYPPLDIIGLKEQKTDKLVVSGNTSSQYISALLMIAPALPNGLVLEIKDGLVSKPYVEMTLSLMKHFGVDVEVSGNNFIVQNCQYSYQPFSVCLLYTSPSPRDAK